MLHMNQPLTNEALRLYDRPDTPFIAAQWRHALRDANVTEAFDAKRLLRILLDLRTTEDAPLRARILTLDHEITALDTTIAQQEHALNTQIYSLYRLSPEEIATVEEGFCKSLKRLKTLQYSFSFLENLQELITMETRIVIFVVAICYYHIAKHSKTRTPAFDHTASATPFK